MINAGYETYYNFKIREEIILNLCRDTADALDLNTDEMQLQNGSVSKETSLSECFEQLHN